MKIGIVGLANVGKSTLFNALTKSYAADSGNFPFCTIDPNIGMVDVKDERVDKLSEISNSKKKVYATTKFVDIAGLVKGASKGEGLGNKFLANIREVDAIVQVVRQFKNDDVAHVEGGVDPLRDVEIVNTELIMADLELISKIYSNLAKRFNTKDKEALDLFPAVEKIKQLLSEGKLAYDVLEELNSKEVKLLKQYNLLTFKPFVYAFNISEANIGVSDDILAEYKDKLNKPCVAVCAKLEEEMIELSEEEKVEYLADVSGGDEVPTLDDLIKLAFDTLGLMYFFTTGEKETRAWTVEKGSKAPQSAGVIHTDFERGFIKAEVVDYDKLLEAGGWGGVREKGYLRLEGKEYIVKDGDVILFRFNV